jgi:hypothetical protein
MLDRKQFLELQNTCNVLTVKRNANFERMFAGTSRCDGEEQRRAISVYVLNLGFYVKFQVPFK